MRDRGILMKSDFRIRNLAFSDRSSKSFVAVITIDYFFFFIKNVLRRRAWRCDEGARY